MRASPNTIVGDFGSPSVPKDARCVCKLLPSNQDFKRCTPCRSGYTLAACAVRPEDRHTLRRPQHTAALTEDGAVTSTAISRSARRTMATATAFSIGWWRPAKRRSKEKPCSGKCPLRVVHSSLRQEKIKRIIPVTSTGTLAGLSPLCVVRKVPS